MVAAAFFAIVGVGRVLLGVSESGSERYSYVWIVLLLPAAALALSQLARRWAPGRWLTVVLAAVVAVNGIGGLAGYADANALLQQREMGDIFGAAHLLTSGAPLAVGGGAEVEVLNSPNLSVADLRSMIAAGKIPMNTPITAADTLAAALYLQVAFTLTPPTTAATAPMLENDVLPLPAMTAGGCVSVADGTAPSNLQLVFTAPGWVAVTPTESGAVSVRLAPERPAGSDIRGLPIRGERRSDRLRPHHRGRDRPVVLAPAGRNHRLRGRRMSWRQPRWSSSGWGSVSRLRLTRS